MAQNIQLFGPREGFLIHQWIITRVRYPQKWPQSHLQFEYVNYQVKFDELDFKLFISGELEVISDPELTPSEKTGRLTLFKKIIYYYSTYEF